MSLENTIGFDARLIAHSNLPCNGGLLMMILDRSFVTRTFQIVTLYTVLEIFHD